MKYRENLFPEMGLTNLKKALNFSYEYTQKLVSENRTTDWAENLVQLCRDIYLMKRNHFLRESASEGLKEIQAGISDEHLAVLSELEKAMRMEEDYLEYCQTIKTDFADSILSSLKALLV